MELINKQIYDCCRKCYYKGIYTKCNEEHSNSSNYTGKHCIKKKFLPNITKKICTCGRFEILFTHDHEGRKEKPEVIDCKKIHPYFLQEDIESHELTCYSCQRQKTDGEQCLQAEWNKKNPLARNLAFEFANEYHSHVFSRKLRSGKVIRSN